MLLAAPVLLFLLSSPSLQEDDGEGRGEKRWKRLLHRLLWAAKLKKERERE